MGRRRNARIPLVAFLLLGMSPPPKPAIVLIPDATLCWNGAYPELVSYSKRAGVTNNFGTMEPGTCAKVWDYETLFLRTKCGALISGPLEYARDHPEIPPDKKLTCRVTKNTTNLP